MTPEERLHAALSAMTSGTGPASDALVRVRDRAHRRRRAVRLRAAGGLVAASLLVAGGPVALRSSRGGRDLGPAAPPATPTAAPSPTPIPTPSGSPAASARPLAAAPDEFVAVTADKDLVLVSATTGRRTRTVARLDTMPAGLDLAPDGRTVYFDVFRPGVNYGDRLTPEQCPTVYSVDLATGARRTVARGYSPRLSPDGSRLAVATCPEPGVRIVGGRTYPYDRAGGSNTGSVASIAWTSDGRGIYVQHGGDDTNPMTRFDPVADRVSGGVSDSRDIVWVRTMFSYPAVPWRDGRLLDAESTSSQPGERYAVSAFRDDPGSEYGRDYEVLFRLPESSGTIDEPAITDLVVGPAGRILVQARSLYRWDGSGEPVRLGPPYALIGW
jgi:hypothetical protein